MDDESKIKRLEDENYRLLEVAKLTREGVQELEKKNREFKAIVDASRAQIKILEQRCVEHETEIAHLKQDQTEAGRALFENEKQRLGKDIEAKAAEEAKLLERIQGLEARCAQKEAELKANEAALAQQAEKHRLALESSEAVVGQQAEQHRLALKANEEASAQQIAKYRLELKAKESALAEQAEKHGLAIKTRESALAQQAEKHRLAIKANESVAAQEAEKHRLTIKEYEAKYRTAEEARRKLEGEKKALAFVFARKTEEETRLRASLQGTGGTMEKLSARVLELKEELQNTSKRLKALQSEKEQLEEERQAALKSDSEKTASLAALEEIKGRLEIEKKRLEDEKRSFGKGLEAKAAEEVRLLGKIQGLEVRYEQKEAAIREYETKNRMLEDAKRNLEGEKKALASELAARAAEETRLRANLQADDGTLEKLNAHVLELKEELQNTSKRLKMLESEKEQLEEERQAALKSDSEKTASLAALEEIKGRLEIEKKRLEDEKRSFGKGLEAKAAEEVRLSKKIQELEARYEQQEAEIKANETAMAQQAEKHRLVLKEYEAAMVQQAEKHRLAIKANEVQQAEKHRLAVKEFETKNRMLEEAKRNLEGEKKALASELAAKTAEEEKLRANLQGAGGTLEKINARVLELTEELQNTNKHLKTLQSEKEQLEREKQAALKSDSEKTASLGALEEIKGRLEIEKKRLEDEKRSFAKGLEAKAAEEVRLLGKIQGLEARYEQREAAIKANEAALAQQAEKQRLAIKEYEAKNRMLEEAKRNLEGEKKALASELATKAAEEDRLRTSLQESDGTLERLNARVLELKEELQNTSKRLKTLQSEKEQMEEERQAALKSDSERAASLAALEEIKGRLENEKKRLEDEKRSFGKELEAKAAEEVRLLKKIQELEARYEQKETEIKAGEVQQAEKYRLAIKANEAQQAEKHRLAFKANEAAMAQQAEKHRLALKEYESKNRTLEELKRNLEGEKKSLASDLAWKITEETRLRASLQEAGGTLEKLNARILELKDELQNTNKQLKILQSEKEQLEEERQAALKLSEKKSSVIAALENDKKLSKSEEQRLWAEKKGLEEERRRLDGEKLRLEHEKKHLEGERRNFGKELEARAAEEVRLLERIRGLEARYEQKEAEIKTNEMQQAEKQRLTVKEHETKNRAWEEAKRNLEGEKKALASELAGKTVEEMRLRASLEEAGGNTEKLNARILKLKEDLQDVDRNFKALQSEKEQLEGERQVALKLNEKKNAIIAALENDKKLFKIDEQRLWTEKKGLEEERRHLEGEKLRLENEKKHLEGERRNFGKELEAKAAEEVRLLEKIQELEARYAQKEAEIKTNEAAVARQTEKRHLAMQAYEAKYQAAEEAKRHLEGEKKALASELAGKAAEEARLRASLEEAGGNTEKLNARILKLKEELQNAIQHFKALQSEKEQVEGARQAALKLNEEKIAAIASLENDKKLSKIEEQRLLAEKKGLEEDKLRLEKALEDRSVQAKIQLEKLTKRCAELDDVINQTRNERDKNASMAEDLTKTIKKMEILLKERETVQAALAGELKQEKEMRMKVQGHAKSLEEAFLALEKKINAIL